MQTYYKIACSVEHEKAGAGLGYEELFGDGGRFFWDRTFAEARCRELNAVNSDDLAGTYSIEERHVYDDGSWDDDADEDAHKQLKPDLV